MNHKESWEALREFLRLQMMEMEHYIENDHRTGSKYAMTMNKRALTAYQKVAAKMLELEAGHDGQGS